MIDDLAWLLDAPDLRTPVGHVILAAAAAALLASVGAHLALSRVSAASSARIVVLGPALVLVPAILAALAKLAWAAREAALDRAISGRLLDDHGSVGRDLRAELGWLWLACILAVLLLPLLGSAMARAATRPATRSLGAGATVLATTAALLACAYVWGFGWALASTTDTGTVPRFDSRAERYAALVDRLRDLDGALATGAWTLLAVALATSLLVLIRRARDRRAMFTTAGLALSALVFAAGLSAFIATRDHAWDRQHPQRLSDREHGFDSEDPLEPIADLDMSCSQLAIGPLMHADAAGRVAIDRRATSSPERLAEELSNLRLVWIMLHPTEPFVGTTILRAQPDTPLARLAPYLRGARTAGYTSLFVDAYTTVPISTRTLGVVQVRRACPVEVELTTGSEPLPRTIEALVREIQDGRTTLALPP